MESTGDGSRDSTSNRAKSWCPANSAQLSGVCRGGMHVLTIAPGNLEEPLSHANVAYWQPALREASEFDTSAFKAAGGPLYPRP